MYTIDKTVIYVNRPTVCVLKQAKAVSILLSGLTPYWQLAER